MNKVCALKELELLGHSFHPDHKKQIRRDYNKKCREAKRKEASKESWETGEPTQNSEFYYIAGYTPAGFAFGITWEEHERAMAEKRGERPPQKKKIKINEDLGEDGIPF